MADHLGNTAITLMYIFLEDKEGGGVHSVSELSSHKQVKINKFDVILTVHCH